MKPNMRRNLPGTFLPQDLDAGSWRLSRNEPAAADLFLRGTDPRANEVLQATAVSDIEVEWRAESVELTLTSGARRRTLHAQSVIVHEPLIRLYETLPLVSLDEKARRFWRRVFLLVRIPGGRYLLRILAHRSRGGG
jgi:hypothetical protein